MKALNQKTISFKKWVVTALFGEEMENWLAHRQQNYQFRDVLMQTKTVIECLSVKLACLCASPD